MAVGRKRGKVFVDFVLDEVVKVASDRPIRSSVIVTAYLSRKKSRNPKWTPKSVGERERDRVDFQLTASSLSGIYVF